MAKIGIMSMQRIVNYGSFLQAYGLKSILEEMGHEVQFVDYHVEKPLIKQHKQKNGIERKLYKVIEALSYDAPLKHRIQFILYKKQFGSKYNKILNISDSYNYNPHLDVLIVGSDEVFNCVQSNTNVGYSLELFGKNCKCRKLITYAASFGNTTLLKLNKYGITEEVAKYLENFDAISVRDNNSANIIQQITEKSIEYNLDPVLAYDYIGKCNLIPQLNIRERYLILYAYSGRISKKEAEWISSYANKRGLKVYAIGGVQKCADRFIGCSPFEVLAYFKNAEEVITDTFHGTIFSIISKRKFVTIIRKSIGNAYGNEEKLSDLLGRFNLIDRAVYNIEDISNVQQNLIDYTKVDHIIEIERLKTVDYLLKEI